MYKNLELKNYLCSIWIKDVKVIKSLILQVIKAFSLEKQLIGFVFELNFHSYSKKNHGI